VFNIISCVTVCCISCIRIRCIVLSDAGIILSLFCVRVMIDVCQQGVEDLCTYDVLSVYDVTGTYGRSQNVCITVLRLY